MLSRSTKYSGHLQETMTTIDANYHRLKVRKVDGMGWGLFADDDFLMANDRIKTRKQQITAYSRSESDKRTQDIRGRV